MLLLSLLFLWQVGWTNDVGTDKIIHDFRMLLGMNSLWSSGWIMDIHLQHDLVNVGDNVLMIQTVDMMGGPNRGCNFPPK